MPEQAKDAATEPKRDEAMELAEKLAAAEWTVNTQERRSLTREEVADLIRPVLQAQRGVVAEEVEKVAREMEANAQRVRAILSNLSAEIDQANTKAWAESLEKSATLLRSQSREISRLRAKVDELEREDALNALGVGGLR